MRGGVLFEVKDVSVNESGFSFFPTFNFFFYTHITLLLLMKGDKPENLVLFLFVDS